MREQGHNVRQAFRRIDTNNNGVLEGRELNAFIHQLMPELSKEDRCHVLTQIFGFDGDGDGRITLKLFRCAGACAHAGQWAATVLSQRVRLRGRQS